MATNLEKSNGMKTDILEAAQQEPSFWEQLEQSFIAQVSSAAESIVNGFIKNQSKEKFFQDKPFIFLNGLIFNSQYVCITTS